MPGRRKHWYRPRNVVAAMLAIAIPVLVWTMWEVLNVYHGEPYPIVDSRQKQRDLFTDRAGIPSHVGEESWRLLAEILDATDDAGEPDAEALAVLRRQGVLDRYGEFANGPPGLRPIRGEGQLDIQIVLDDCGRAQTLARIGAAAMRFAAADGDLTGAAAAFDRTLALARTMAWQPYLISYLTAVAIESLAMSELRHELMELDFDEPTCRTLLASLDRHAACPSVEYALEAERIFFEDWVQWSYSDDGAGDGYLVGPEQSVLGAALSRLFSPSRSEIETAHDTLMDGLIRQGRVPASISDLPNRYLTVRLLAKPLEHVIQNDATRVARVEGTRVMVALELHRAQHGAYPESLDQLIGDGGPFGYRLLTDDPEGRPYLLYSIDPEGGDDLVINEPGASE